MIDAGSADAELRAKLRERRLRVRKTRFRCRSKSWRKPCKTTRRRERTNSRHLPRRRLCRFIKIRRLAIHKAVDLIPDFTPIVGYSDDAAAVALAIGMAQIYIDDEVKQKAKKRIAGLFGENVVKELD